MKLQGKIAIVTGGAQGIGKATSLRLSSEGASVVVADLNLDEAKKLAGEINASGQKAIAVKINVTSSQDAKQMVKEAIDTLGKVDILVNVAGGSPHKTRSMFHESLESTWDMVLSVNLKGTLNCCRAVINHMIERQSGKIINMGSIGGLVGTKGLADYSAAKGGIVGFTKALAKEVGQYKVNVNVVCPGPIASEYFLTLSDEWLQRYLQSIILGRLGTPEEVAGMVNYLASDEADWVTGQAFVIDGGRSIGIS